MVVAAAGDVRAGMRGADKAATVDTAEDVAVTAAVTAAGTVAVVDMAEGTVGAMDVRTVEAAVCTEASRSRGAARVVPAFRTLARSIRARLRLTEAQRQGLCKSKMISRSTRPTSRGKTWLFTQVK